jgi:prephenate dehydrogenase
MLIDTLTIVGVGLIGGSIGLAARKRSLARRVRGLGRNRDSLEQAKSLGAIDEVVLEPAVAATAADLIVVCTPVDLIARHILELAPYCAAGALITDAGSTKARIVEEVEQALPEQVHFIGSHPLAGSEKRGPQYADAYLFHNRWVVLTPTPRTDPAALNRARAFWQALGARVKVMTPAEHDRGLALTSHLPHLLASALAATLPLELFDLAATGFRDTTRIAAGDPSLWTAIFAHNRAALLTALDRFEENLHALRSSLAASDWQRLENLLIEAKQVRDGL